MKLFNIFLMTAAVLITGCAANEVTKEKYSGFLGNYSQLQQSPTYPASKIFIEPKTNFSNYKTIIIEKVVILSGGALAQPNNSLLQSIASTYQGELKKSFKAKGYTIVTHGGVGTARIQAAITSVHTSFDDLKAYQYIPTSAAITGAMRASGSAKKNARVMMEAKVTDAKTGQLLASIVDLQKGKEVEESGEVTLNDVRPVLKQWAKRFATAFSLL